MQTELERNSKKGSSEVKGNSLLVRSRIRKENPGTETTAKSSAQLSLRLRHGDNFLIWDLLPIFPEPRLDRDREPLEWVLLVYFCFRLDFSHQLPLFCQIRDKQTEGGAVTAHR